MKKFLKISDGKSIHLRQGDLDGACTVYSLMMGLIAAKKVKKDDLLDLDKYEKTDGRTSFGRLLKEFFERKPESLEWPETILLRKGYLLSQIQDKLSRSFGKMVKSLYGSTELNKDESGYMNKKEMLAFIAEEIDNGCPVEIEFDYRNCDFGHAVLVVGYEMIDGDLQKLFCLDPGFEAPEKKKYNAVIILHHNGKNVQYHEQRKRVVSIKEALSLE